MHARARKIKAVIRLKRIYNFLVIHASFVLLSHVFTVNYIIFMHFVRLTYWQDAKLSFCFRNLLLEIFSERAANFYGFFTRQDDDRVKRAALEESHRAGATCGRGLPLGRGRSPPAPCGSPPRLPSGLHLRLGVKIIPVNFCSIPRIFPEVNFWNTKTTKTWNWHWASCQ